MRTPCGVRPFLFAASVHVGWGQDAVSLLQQSVGSPSTPSSTQATVYKVGEAVQVKFEGEKRWVDCSILAKGASPDSYNIHVPIMGDGLLKDKTFNDVPWKMLRRVQKGYEVNIEQGGNVSSWISCMVLDKQGKNFKVELLDLRPGMVLENVAPELLREEGGSSVNKVDRLKQMIKENEAKKSELFYMAEVAKRMPDKAKEEEERMKRQKQEDDAKTEMVMKLHVWKEMADRARKEEEELKAKKELAAKKEAENIKAFDRKQKAKELIEMDLLVQHAETDPVAALVLKTHAITKEMKERGKVLEKKFQEKVDEENKMKELKKKLAQQKAKAIEDNIEMIKREREAVRRKAANGTVLEVSPAAKEAKKQVEAMAAWELDQKKHQILITNELNDMAMEEEKRYKEDEVRRKDSMRERQQAIARRKLRVARKTFEDDHSKKKEAGVSALLSAIGDAVGAGVDDPLVDATRVLATTHLTSLAREAMAAALRNGTLSIVEPAVNNLQSKAKDIDAIWSKIEDPESKWHTSHFEESELDSLRQRVPELRRQEAMNAAMRSSLILAKVNRKLLKKAINAAEKGGLPSKEIEKARGRLQLREAKPTFVQPIKQAIKASDVGALASAISRAEAFGKLDPGFMHHARHMLKAFRDRGLPEKKVDNPQGRPKEEAAHAGDYVAP